MKKLSKKARLGGRREKEKIRCSDHQGKDVVVTFDAGQITSDAGVLLFREINRLTGIIPKFAECFTDKRVQSMVAHPLVNLLAQRVQGLCCGYEDQSDHDDLRFDAGLALLTEEKGIDRSDTEKLSGKSTLQRVERALVDGESEKTHKIHADEEAIDRFIVDFALSKHEKQPKEVVIDLDAALFETYGNQEDSEYNGFYRCFGYLPLLAFWGDDIVMAKVRRGNAHSATDVLKHLEPVLERIREKWSDVAIIVRADCGYCVPDLINRLDEMGVGFVIGMPGNAILKDEVSTQLKRAEKKAMETGKSAQVFTAFDYQTQNSWNDEHRIVAKAEHTVLGDLLQGDGEARNGSNPRFLVTNLGTEKGVARRLYKRFYTKRGEAENRIKETGRYVFGDRMSSGKAGGNQMRLYFSAAAYMIMIVLKEQGFALTEWHRATIKTIRQKYVKIAALVKESRRQHSVQFNSAYPHKETFQTVLKNLRAAVLKKTQSTPPLSNTLGQQTE